MQILPRHSKARRQSEKVVALLRGTAGVAALRNAAAVLEPITRFVRAVDSDAPGGLHQCLAEWHSMRHELLLRVERLHPAARAAEETKLELQKLNEAGNCRPAGPPRHRALETRKIVDL